MTRQSVCVGVRALPAFLCAVSAAACDIRPDLSLAELLKTMVMAAGFITAIGAWALIIIEAFKVRILWGLACLLFSPAGILFVVTHWRATRGAAVTACSGVVICVLGMALP